MSGIDRVMRRIDAYQQRRPWLSFPFAVIKKFGDDRAGNLAALIAYYGFFSLFPLLLTFVSILGIVLKGNVELQQRLLDSALRDFPVIGEQIAKDIHAISGNAVVLAIGILGTLWAGLGVTQAAQTAMNQVWDVPRKAWPNFLKSRLRGLILLVVLGSLTVAATFATGLASSGGPAFVGVVVGIAVSLVLNLALFLLAYRVLTAKDLSWGDVFPGAAVASVIWTAMQSLGTYYVTHQIKNASDVYGTFALVIGLLVWIYLGAQMFLMAAEVNVVRKGHLWPRSVLQQPPLAPADEAVMERGAKVEERIPDEEVSVDFDGRQDPTADPSPEASEEPAEPTREAAMEASPNGADPEARKRGGFLKSAAVGAGAVAVAGVISKLRRRRRPEED
jgi:YihY family inner membrane protein